MKYIKLNNDFGIDREKEKEVGTDQEITANWISAAIAGGYPQMKSDQRQMFNSIIEKIDKVMKEKGDYLEVDAFSYSFIKRAFDNWATSPSVTKSVVITENAVLNATDEIPA